MLRLSLKFQKISLCSFLSRRHFIPILTHFLKILLQNMEASIVQNQIRWHILFFIMAYLPMQCLGYYQNFKRFYRVVILVEYIYSHFGTFSEYFPQKYGGLHLAKTNLMTYSFFILNYLMLCLFHYQNFNRFHCVVFLVEGAVFQLWHFGTFSKDFTQKYRSRLCARTNFDDIFFFHHDFSPYAMLRLLRKFQKISQCSFPSRGRYISLCNG